MVSSGSASEEMAQLKDALVWITEIYPKDLPEEYLLIATMGRWGWVSSQGDEATRTAQFREDLLAALPPHFRAIVETGLILGARSPTREETTKRSPFFSIGWNTPRIDRRQPTKNVFCVYVTTRRPGANKG